MTRRLFCSLLLGACVISLGFTRNQDEVDTRPANHAIPILTQRLMNALPGDATIWRRYLSERAVYVSEAGEIVNKKELLEGFTSFPQGITGSIEVKNVRITEFDSMAVAVFDAHEKQAIYDQRIEVNYRSTWTWRRENNRWRVIAAHNVVLAKDPAPLPIDTRRLADYVGTYELSGKRRYHIEQQGNTLRGGREGSQLMPLIAVGDNVFVEAGSNLGILRIFVRGKNGGVERMIQRRKFADLDWVRLAPVNPSGTPGK